MPELSKRPVVKRDVLERVGDARLAEANTLKEAGHYGSSIYLAGYAVECWLKVAIYSRLDWTEMHATFTTQDLELLLLHSGLERRIQAVHPVHGNFAKIQEVWTMGGSNAIRYQDPAAFDEKDAAGFLDWVTGNDGVVPWVRKQI